MTADRPLLGIALMMGFCVLAPLADALAKVVGGTVPILELILIRFLFQALLMPPVMATGGLKPLPRKTLLRIVLRTVLHIIGIGCMFTGLKYLPLADAVAIAFVMPFIMLLLGKVFLGEEVGPRRLIACAIGFIGTLLVLQPAFADTGWPALLPLCVAVVFALFMLVTRQIAKEVDAVPLQAISGVIAVILLLPVWVYLGAPSPFRFDGTTLWLLVAIGVLGTGGHLLMTWALRFAPAASLAPMQYLEIPMATLFGYLIFSDLPGPMASLGIGLTIAAGVYIILRERAMYQARPAAPI
ncbi:MAG: DMT family transporter [Thalassococcus sp.]|uniref:DMT family transporter n=1 Tax=Thalassococcus sp. TaxID=1928858 RepID=UPI001B24E3A0|nr:DMT family transporter [Thalassococcus sp.]MBO6868810.1 DMT family transporter [Thalassococcus sp.]